MSSRNQAQPVGITRNTAKTPMAERKITLGAILDKSPTAIKSAIRPQRIDVPRLYQINDDSV
jgi:hypothetical protein